MVPRVWFCWVLVLVSVAVPVVGVQPTRFASEDVRVTSAAPGDRPVSRVTDDGGYFATNVTLKRLIEDAYRRSGFERRVVTGGPAWMSTERFDVVALPPPGGLQPDNDGLPRRTLRLLQEMLNDRFQLRLVVAVEERLAYVLVATTANGPRLMPSTVDCDAARLALANGERGVKLCGAAPYPGRLTANGVTMADLAGLMTPYLDRVVVDRTELSGRFDVDLEGVEFQPTGPFGPSSRPSETRESVFRLIQPQLGLKLEPATARVETLFVETAERPGDR